jgi:hypothetical protein
MAIINLTPPSATGGQAEQVRNLYSYLYQLTDRLNAAFVALDVGGSDASGASVSAGGTSSGMSADQARQYNELKALIIKTGTVTKEYADKLVASLDSVYIAQSEWGTYEEQIHQDIEATASGIVESYNFQSQIDALDDYRVEASGYILRGIIGYDEDNVPIFGIAIGQDLKTTEVTIDGVTYKQVDMTKSLATYTADGITFWLNGVAVARLNQQELFITRAVITEKITLGDWEIATNGTGINKQVGTALDISGNSAITSLVSGQEGMQTQITQNAESISAKASQTEVDALTGRVTQTEADIEAVPGKISLAVRQVQVGGRNYLLGTGEAYVAESDGSARTWLFPWKCADEDTAHSLYGKTITISFDYDQAITSGAFTLAFHHTWGAVKVFNAGTAAGQRFEETFDLPEPETFASNNPNVVIYIDGTWNGSVTFRNLKMEIGNKATDWTPAPEDGYKSSYIEIRDDHVDISTGGRFRVTSGDVDITTSKFSVSITDETGGEDELLTIDATGVRAANLSAPNVAMRYDGPWQIIVNSGATSAQVESGSYVRSMQEAFDRLNDRFLPYYAEVKLETDTYENVNIHGIYAGNGSLAIVGQGHTVYGRIIISNINTHMQAISLRACNANGDVWWIGNCRYVYLKTCTAEGYSTASAGYHIDYGSVVTFESCEVYNCITGVDAGWGTKVDIATLKGTTTQYAYKAFGAVITNTGSRPSGIWAAMNCISMPNDLLTVPIDTGSGVVVPTTGSATFNPSATGTYTTYWWNIDSDVRQGYTKSNGRIKGGIFYAVSGVSGTVKSAILKLTRLKNYGKGAPVQVKVYGTVSTGKSGNPALSTEGYVLGTIDGGQTAEFALPAALATGLGNGTYKGIILYADDTTALHGKTYSTNYTRFAAAAPLTITWTT